MQQYFLAAITTIFAMAGFTSGAAFSLVLNISGGLAGSLVSFVLPGALYVAKMPCSAPYYLPCLVMLLGGAVLVVLIPYSVLTDINKM